LCAASEALESPVPFVPPAVVPVMVGVGVWDDI